MSSCDKEKVRNSESLEFPIKSEMEDSFPHTAVKLQNNHFVDSVGLFDDDSLFMDPGMEFKAEPEIFESSEGDMKYSFDTDASVSKEDLRISKRKFNKEEESVQTGVKEECGIQLGSSRRGDKENRRGMGKECLQNEEHIENSGCKKTFFQESDSKTHTDVDMREKSFVGGNYEKQFSGVVNPNSHMLVHTGDQFRYRECGKTFSKQVDLKAHYETHTRRRSFKCNDCGKVFFGKSLLIAHLRIHNGEKPFQCSVCDKTFSDRSNLTTHYRIHTGEKRFKCSVCDKAFRMKSHLTTHYRIHTGEKPFKCSVCDKAFYVKSHLTSHNRIHTREKPFKCSVCDKEFSDRIHLTIHYRLHTGEKPFKCSLCDKAFSERSNLTTHYRIHTGEKPFKCSVCDKAFSMRSHVTIHYRIHTGEKPFKCSVCDKAFSNKSGLKIHYRIHTGEKPFKCSVCDKAFTVRSQVRIHNRIHTGEKPFKCSVCDKAFSYKCVLKQHYRIHTGPQKPPRQGTKRKGRQFLSDRWSLAEKKVLFFCFTYSRYEGWGRCRNQVFEEKIRESDLPPEKIAATHRKLLTSIVSHIPKYLPEEEIEKIKKEAESKARSDYEEREVGEQQEYRKGIWDRKEEWILIWAMEYAKEKFTRKNERCNEWQRIFHHHCPNKTGIPRSKLSTQKFNFLALKHFNEDEFQKMREEVKNMIKKNKCPIKEPLGMPVENIDQVRQRPSPPTPQSTTTPRQRRQDRRNQERQVTTATPEPPGSPSLLARAQKNQRALQEEKETTLHLGDQVTPKLLDPEKWELEEELANKIEETKTILMEDRP